MALPQKIKNLELLYDPEVPLLSIYHKELKAQSQRGFCTLMFTAALFTVTTTWKQPKCLLMDEWISKMKYIHTLEYCSALKREEIL